MRECLHGDRWTLLGNLARLRRSFRQPERRAARRQKMTRKEFAKALTKVKNQRSDLQVKALCREMVERFGGLKGIAEAWGRSLDQDLGRGGYAAFRHLEAILRLTQYCEQNRPNYGAMTDEELESHWGAW